MKRIEKSSPAKEDVAAVDIFPESSTRKGLLPSDVIHHKGLELLGSPGQC